LNNKGEKFLAKGVWGFNDPSVFGSVARCVLPDDKPRGEALPFSLVKQKTSTMFLFVKRCLCFIAESLIHHDFLNYLPLPQAGRTPSMPQSIIPDLRHTVVFDDVTETSLIV
jgi:hypothetical protein